MKKINEKLLAVLLILIGLHTVVSAQVSTNSNGAPGTAADYDGWNATRFFPLTIAHKGAFPINFQTNGLQRMTIMPNTGFVGIATSSPQFLLHVDPIGTTAATSTGWKRGILLSHEGALMWEGAPSTSLNYFMAHSSSTPAGDFFQGISAGIGSGAAVNYSAKVHVGSGGPGPQASTQIFKWLLVEEGGFERRFGVNTVNPAQVAEIKSNTAATWQLRLTHNTGAWTDFQTRNTGNLNILPQSGNTGFNMNANPTHTIDVNGNARIRIVPDDVTPDFLLLGNPLATDDMEVQKLAFSGSSTDVLLGNGTWGTATSTTTANNGLSIASGDVVLGQGCFSPGSPGKLLSDRVIPMNNFTLYFTGQGIPTADAIGLGYPGCFTMPAKFNVLEQTGTAVFVTTYASHFRNSDFGDPSTSSLFFIGVHGRSDANQIGNNTNIGGDFFGLRAPISIGVRGQAQGVGITSVSMGGKFTAVGLTSNTNYGIYAEANNAISTSYAVYGTSLPAVGTSPLSSTLPRYAGYFDGDVYVSGIVGPSDIALKENIDTITSALTIIDQLKPKKFNYKSSSFPSMNLQDGLQYGLIAQDVETVLPDLVTENIHPAQYDTLGVMINAAVNFKGLEYQQLIPILIKGIQEQQKSIDNLTAQLIVMQDCILESGLCEEHSILTPGDVKSKKDVELKDALTLVLDQNVPNPFAEMTTITYSLNDGVQKAQMLFYNATGKLINSLDLQTTSGKGQLNVFANDLSNGIYTYTLIVDGKIVDTKRMVKNK